MIPDRELAEMNRMIEHGQTISAVNAKFPQYEYAEIYGSVEDYSLLVKKRRISNRQHSVPVDGHSLPAQDLHPVGRKKEFPNCLSVRYLPLLPGFTWRNGVMNKPNRVRAGNHFLFYEVFRKNECEEWLKNKCTRPKNRCALFGLVI